MNWTEFVDSEFFGATGAFQNFQRRSKRSIRDGEQNPHATGSIYLFDFAMDSMLVAVGTELAQLHAGRGVTTVLHGGVARNSRRTLVRIGPALGTFERNYNSYAFTFCHGFTTSKGRYLFQTRIIIIS